MPLQETICTNQPYMGDVPCEPFRDFTPHIDHVVVGDGESNCTLERRSENKIDTAA